MPVCGHPKQADCVHEASKALNDLDVIDLRDKQGLYKCQECDHPIRAHEVGNYFRDNDYPTVDTLENEGTYLVHETRDVDGQGHVYVYSYGQEYGNGLYNWEGGNVSRTIYKLD